MDNDLDKRATDFNAELKTLLAKYHLALGAVAQLTADGRVAAIPKLQEAVDPPPELKP